MVTVYIFGEQINWWKLQINQQNMQTGNSAPKFMTTEGGIGLATRLTKKTDRAERIDEHVW